MNVHELGDTHLQRQHIVKLLQENPLYESQIRKTFCFPSVKSVRIIQNHQSACFVSKSFKQFKSWFVNTRSKKISSPVPFPSYSTDLFVRAVFVSLFYACEIYTAAIRAIRNNVVFCVLTLSQTFLGCYIVFMVIIFYDSWVVCINIVWLSVLHLILIFLY